MWFSRCLWSRPRQYIGPLSVRKMIIIILIIIIFVAIIIIIIIIMGMMTIISHFAEYTKLVIIIIICQKEELTLVSAAPPLLLLVVAFTSSKGMSFSFSRSPPTIFSGKFSKPIIGSSFVKRFSFPSFGSEEAERDAFGFNHSIPIPVARQSVKRDENKLRSDSNEPKNCD